MNTNQISNLFKNNTFQPFINTNIPYIFLNPLGINGNNETKPSLINNNTQINPIDKNSFINIPFINNADKNIIKYPNQNIFLDNLGINNLYLYNNLSKINNNNQIHNPSNYPSFINNNNLFNINNTNNNYSNLFNLNEFNDENDILSNDFENESKNSNNSSPKKYIPKFYTILMHKRGRHRYPRKYNENPYRIHSSSAYDNILRKIQVHYLNFIISYINEILDVILPNYKKLRFLKLSYNRKIQITNNYFRNLKNGTIGEILRYEISVKYLKYDRDYNKKTYEKIYKENNFMNNIFNMNYLEFFNRYYMNKNIKLWIYGKEVTFKKAKFFSDLLKAYPILANKMEEIVKMNYNVNNNTFFKVDKNDDL